MLTSGDIAFIRERLRELSVRDRDHLDRLRGEIRALKDRVRIIRPRTTTSVAFVATDAGENVIAFDPHLFYPIRVVDSHGRVLFLDVLTPWADVEDLNQRHIQNGIPQTPLGHLMIDLGVSAIWDLSPMIPDPQMPLDRRNRRWIQDYRDLGEWASLYCYLVHSEFATDTLVVRDGFLRSKIFSRDLFAQMWNRIQEAVEHKRRETGRKIFVVGIAKHSKVLDRYHLALFLERVLVQRGACYVRVPAEIERQVYRWREYAPGEEEEEERESQKFVKGALFLAKFGRDPLDPIWAVDVWELHEARGEVDEVFGYLLGNAQVGFPRPFYPLCLQQAHEQAQMSGLDVALLQDLVLQTIREEVIPDQPQALEAFRLIAGEREERSYAIL